MMNVEPDDFENVGVNDSLELGGDEPLDAAFIPAKTRSSNPLIELKKQQEEAENKKAMLNVFGGIAQGLANVPSAYEIYTGKHSPRTDYKSMFGAAANAVGNPMDDQQKAFAYLNAKRQNAAGERTEKNTAAYDDANSDDSKAYREQLGGMFPKLAPYLEGKSRSQIGVMMPLLEQKIKGEEARTNAEISAGMRREDRADARDARRSDMAEARALKQQELSGPQAKQRGLYESGKLAEDQYKTAIGDGKKFDPTSNFHPIDNSDWAPNWLKNNKAVESKAAQSAWIEGFLRDASGAAIPPSERMAYAKDFFAQPGDSADVVANKEALRQQKMDNAKVAAGLNTGHGPAETASRGMAPGKDRSKRTVIKTQTNQKTGEKRVVYSDGTTETMPGSVAGG